jgi:hypothetical protein
MGECVSGHTFQWSVVSANKAVVEVKMTGDRDELCLSGIKCRANSLTFTPPTFSPYTAYHIPY